MKRKKYNTTIMVLSVLVTVLAAVCVALVLSKTGVLPSVLGKEKTTESTEDASSSTDSTEEASTNEITSESSEPSDTTESSDTSSESVSESTSESETQASSQSTEKIMKTTADLNVRTGPGTSYDKVGLIPSGTQVTIIGEENGWSKIEYNGSQCYVSSAYLTNAETTSSQAETTSAQTQTTTTSASVVVGTTTKGYKIETIDGVTYVDGVLIANKTYSLPQNYGSGLTEECSAAFNKMSSAAKADGVTLTIVSGFRSYDTQNRIYNNYVAKDGKAGADTYSARPGASEHQTGLAMDLNSLYTSFGQTKEGKWLAANCYKYGFIIRFPEGKESITGYSYEPWHVRYLGVEKATKIYQSGLCLEEYYGITSKYSD